MAALNRKELPDGEAGRAAAELDHAVAARVVQEARDVPAAVDDLPQPILLRPVVAPPMVVAGRQRPVADILRSRATPAVGAALDRSVAVSVIGPRQIAAA